MVRILLAKPTLTSTGHHGDIDMLSHERIRFCTHCTVDIKKAMGGILCSNLWMDALVYGRVRKQFVSEAVGG
jgi:hypothetical protein